MSLDPRSIRIRIVPLDQVHLHEDFDPWRVKHLVSSLRRHLVLKNPIIVTEDGGRYVVLDGATRAMALREMGIPHIVAQIVPYEEPTVRLSRWNHIVVGLRSPRLLAAIDRIPGLTSSSCSAEAMLCQLESRESIFGVLTDQGRCLAYFGDAEPKGKLGQLNEAVAAYRGKAEVHRAAELDIPALRSLYPDLSAVIAFPAFTPGEVLHFALNEVKLPMGLTRHLINGRVLGTNVPLNALSGCETDLVQKNAWLEEMLQTRFRRNMVRVYEEPTIVLDE